MATDDNISKKDLIQRINDLQKENSKLKDALQRATQECKRNRTDPKLKKPYDFSSCNFRHVLLKFLYLGWDYQGYAVQEDNDNTIEHHLFSALIKTCLIKDRASANYHRCGRTDKGVSSFGQVISIDLRSKFSKEDQHNENELNYCNILNRVLPSNIQCLAWCPVEEGFSARFDCKSRTYKYFFPKADLDIEKMRASAKYIIGTHDFRHFCKMDVGNGVVQFVRKIIDIDIEDCYSSCNNEKQNFSLCVLTMKGQAFLYHQVRCIMGILFLIGSGREEPNIVLELLDVTKHPRKPNYNLASEIPLNLYVCDYDIESEWIYDNEAIKMVVQQVQAEWATNKIKSTMLEFILSDIGKQYQSTLNSNLIGSCLLNGVKARNYVPLLQRPKCESLEERIKHYAKKRKIKANEAV